MRPLDGGLPEASWYMRRPIAVLPGRDPDAVLARFGPAERAVSDTSALTEVWLRYGDLVVTTLVNGSPILGRLGNRQLWASFTAMAASGILNVRHEDTPWRVPDTPPGTLTFGATQLACVHYWSAPDVVTRLTVPPETLMRYADCTAVAVTGSPQEVDGARLGLLAPEPRLVSMVVMGDGPYPRFRQWPRALRRER